MGELGKCQRTGSNGSSDLMATEVLKSLRLACGILRLATEILRLCSFIFEAPNINQISNVSNRQKRKDSPSTQPLNPRNYRLFEFSTKQHNFRFPPTRNFHIENVLSNDSFEGFFCVISLIFSVYTAVATYFKPQTVEVNP
jgi:hypothetical protein